VAKTRPASAIDPDFAAPVIGSVRKRERAPRTSVVAKALRSSALELFAKQNYSSISIKEISDATGVNPSLIYYYFGSKEGLFLEIIESTVEEAFTKFEAVKANLDQPEDIIASWIEIHIMQFVLLQKLAKISLDYASRPDRTPRIDKAVRQFYDKESIVLKQAIQAGIDRGLFREVDPTEVSLFISTFLDGVLFRSVMFPTLKYKAVIAHMRRVVLRHIRAGAQAG
jgi:AcrR family transcriptional regulator